MDAVFAYHNPSARLIASLTEARENCGSDTSMTLRGNRKCFSVITVIIKFLRLVSTDFRSVRTIPISHPYGQSKVTSATSILNLQVYAKHSVGKNLFPSFLVFASKKLLHQAS